MITGIACTRAESVGSGMGEDRKVAGMVCILVVP